LMLGELLRQIHDAGLSLSATEGEDVLRVSPAFNLTSELVTAIKEHKEHLIRVILEDRRFRETGIIQCERQVFDLACEYFGLNEKGGAGA
jgi:hypothetical protein